jgi:hypothetical protein
VQATRISPRVTVMHQIRLMGECVDRLAVVQARFVDEMEARMYAILDARAIGGGSHSETRLVELIRQGTQGIRFVPCGNGGGHSWRWRWCASSTGTAIQASRVWWSLPHFPRKLEVPKLWPSSNVTALVTRRFIAKRSASQLPE